MGQGTITPCSAPLMSMRSRNGHLLLVLGLDLPFWSVMVIAGLLGIVAGYTNIFVVSWLQGNIGTNFRGSVMSALVLGSTGLAPISLAVSGLLVQLGFPTLFVSAGLMLSIVVIFMALRSKEWSREATVALSDATFEGDTQKILSSEN